HLEQIAGLLFIVDDQDVTFHLRLPRELGGIAREPLSSTARAHIRGSMRRTKTGFVACSPQIAVYPSFRRGKMPRSLPRVTVGTRVVFPTLPLAPLSVFFYGRTARSVCDGRPPPSTRSS